MLFGEYLLDEIKYAFKDAHLDITYRECDWYDDVLEHEGIFSECGTSAYIGGSYDTWELIVIGGTYYIEYQHGKEVVYFYSVKPNVKGFVDRDYIDISNIGYARASDSIVAIITSIMLDDDCMIFWN